jgi:uncharacterized protein
MGQLDRRTFLRTSLVAASGAMITGTLQARGNQDTPAAKTPAAVKHTRKLGRTGLVLPVVSMGVMRSDNPGLVRTALEKGMRHLDTAHYYQKGRNEEMLGKLLANVPRDSFVISTKVPPESGESAAAIKAWLGKVELSLQRLKMDHIDILYLHGTSSKDETVNPVMLDALEQAKQKGYTRFLGVSTHKNEPDVIDAAVDSGIYDVVLTSVNFKQDHYRSVKAAIARAAKAGVGIVGMKTMAGGFLDKDKQKPINCKAALKFVLQDPNVVTTIPGITSFDQLDENCSVNQDLVLSEEEQDALAVGRLEGGLYCQGCEHCVAGCSRGLAIPEYMRAFMYAYGYRDLAMAQNVVNKHETGSDPCIDCSSCSAACVKGFPVRERIADVRRVGSIPEELLS